MAGNKSLGAARVAKEDEFYTQLTDVEKEMRHYRKHFKNKTVFCNCDDPFESNFFKYFVLNFNRLGLRKLIATCYASSPIANNQLSLFDVIGNEENKQNKPYKAVVTKVYDKTGDGGIDMFDVAELFKSGENELTELIGDGDFRSPECVELLKQADIVATNPPFSLFREYVALLMEQKKDFVIVGNQNAVAYKDFFPLLSDNKIWLGYNSGHFWFKVPDSYEVKKTDFKIDENGQKWRRMGNICWFTNLDIEKRHEDMTLFRNYSPDKYPTYDNFDAIEVSKTADIPCDYYGVMGVPITFMSQYSPEQFEIVGLSQKCGFGANSIKFYDDYKEVKQDGTPTGSTGKKTNGNPMLAGKPLSGNYYTNGKEIVRSLYSRIFIKRVNTNEN